MRIPHRTLTAIFLQATILFLVGPIANGQDQTQSGLPPEPTMATDLHAVGTEYKLEFGSLIIRPGSEYNAIETRNENGIGGGSSTTHIWFISRTGQLQYFSPDHARVIWEGGYTDLKLVATLSIDADGKRQLDIPAGSLWVRSIVINNPPPTASVMGANIAISKLSAGFWNPDPVRVGYDTTSQVSSQVGALRFLTSQQIKLQAAKLSVPSCQLAASLDFDSAPPSQTAFDYKLGDSILTIHNGRFVSSAFARRAPTRIDCTTFHTVLTSIATGPLIAEISPSDIEFRSSIISARGAFLAKLGGEPSLPVIGRGRVSTTAIEASTSRASDDPEIDRMSVGGLQFISAAPPGVSNYRRLANDIGVTLALPDFLSPDQQQLKAIDDTSDALSKLSLTTSDVLVHVPGTEINALIAQKLKEIGIPRLISFGFSKQEVLAFIPSPSVNSPVSLALHMAVSVGDTFVSIRPSVSFAPLSNFSSSQLGPGKKSLADIASYWTKKLSPILKPLTTLNTEIKIPIPTSDVEPVDLTKSITDPTTGITIDVKSTKTTISIAIPQKVLLIDPDGLHLLVHVDVN